ncbi:MAG TPA: hypothetical protein PKD09_09395 [Aggregatilinea sp.]|uniref:hypothetical protein n=1 Tax=Aggregatilinea sp. TaxID=2806333 RepID=UPI002BC40167|nr:hypothetical protein [Aggregatilinea sp.]HML21851.1 hypothetical protein [Aggregatilinea sp.]
MDELNNVRKVRPEWAQVMNETVLVDLTVGRWRGSVKTNWEQLGLPASAFNKAFTPGARRLLPDTLQKELDQIEQLARQTLKRLSYDTLFGQLMPKESYFEFRAWLKERPLTELRRWLYRSEPPKYADASIWDNTTLYERWFQLAQEIAYNRDVIVDEVASLYDQALENVWRRQHDISPRSRDLDVQEEVEFADWLDQKKAGIVASIPSADYIRESFVLDWTLAEVETPPEAVKAAKLEELEARARELDAQIDAATDEKRRLIVQRERERVEMEQRIQEEIARTRADAGDRFNEAINQIIGQLQGSIYEMVLDQLAYLEDNQSLHPRNVGRIKNLVELVKDKLVGLTDDASLKQACNELEALAASGTATRAANAGEVQQTLRQIAIDMKVDLVAAGVPSRSGRELGIPDEPTRDDMARRERRLFQNGDVDLGDAPTRGDRYLP